MAATKICKRLARCHGLAPWRLTCLLAWPQGYSAIRCERETSRGKPVASLAPQVGRMWQATSTSNGTSPWHPRSLHTVSGVRGFPALQTLAALNLPQRVTTRLR